MRWTQSARKLIELYCLPVNNSLISIIETELLLSMLNERERQIMQTVAHRIYHYLWNMETLVTARSGVQRRTKGIQTVILYSNEFILKRRIDRKTDNIFAKFTMRLARQVCYSFPCGWRNRSVTILIRLFDRTVTCMKATEEGSAVDR